MSVQHAPDISLEKVREQVENLVIKEVIFNFKGKMYFLL